MRAESTAQLGLVFRAAVGKLEVCSVAEMHGAAVPPTRIASTDSAAPAVFVDKVQSSDVAHVELDDPTIEGAPRALLPCGG